MHQDLELFSELCDFLLDEEKNNPVATPIATSELFEKLDLSLKDEGVVDQDLTLALKAIIKHTPKTASTSFFNQLFGGRKGKASLGDLLSVMLNNSMYTYKVAGPQVGLEKEIISQICRLSGYPEGSGGTLAAGGSMTNFMALLMARDHKFPEIRTEGTRQNITLYTSEASHYSIAKNAALAGIGSNNVRLINCNAKGEMSAEHLEEVIENDVNKGFIPFFVNATAGTTVLGAFDNITALSQVCKKHNIWLHVDGAYCGSVIFSNRYKHLVKGLELTDSFSLNAHKMLGTPLSCSIIITKHKEQLHHSFSNEAEYLYQTDGDDYNLGKTSLQCGRRNDALKLWTLWKSVGTKGLEKIVDHQFELAQFARDYINNHPDYTLNSFDDSISVCFNYKDVPANTLCTALYEDSKLMVGFGKFRNTEFVRMVTINTVLEKEDILNFFETIETYVSKELLKNSLS
ncbi:pyridoxal phosphate-dependent decarboxylase family protein [Winogradskyella jejuensis]|uniref:Sulfinoalanine decarboxylase/sulfinoalanine decarboxylase / aspartate 1-decarboxylase n=1 Tax=Winogradskyella jejuensis TaxID=1089305 RepID=A0A1M5L705_9FLAO|nr:aminotransferase class V-fold PLP-dependent enzyme [Winogradskyella jejuensis]SHG60695.1 sulfinoalanine decarboxylase/sulfinoalanine decarboxylase / aspartate 1-decarboxylase [Winogradskyella jejuensis]